MNRFNRDLLVLFNQEVMSPQAIELEVERLHEMLYDIESLDSLVKAHEVLNLNNYKINNKADDIRLTIRNQELKPFIFLNCKN